MSVFSFVGAGEEEIVPKNETFVGESGGDGMFLAIFIIKWEKVVGSVGFFLHLLKCCCSFPVFYHHVILYK